MGSEQYCLKWNNHWANLVRVFNSLRHTETFVDVTIACEGRHVKAHRLILSACSPYFKELLVSHPDKHPIIILKDVRYAELQNLIQFIYNGEVSVEQHDLASLLCTARELQIKGLADDCISNSLPFAVTAKTVKASEIRALKDSTNSSSILLPIIPKDQPTCVNVDANITTSVTTTTTTTTTCSTPTTSSFAISSQTVCSVAQSCHDSLTTQTDPVDTTFKGPQNEGSLPPSPYESSRDGSPLSKRRKMSRASVEESYASSSISSLSDEVVKLKVPPNKEEKGTDSAGPSGFSKSVSPAHPKEDEEIKIDDSSDEKENQKPEVEMLKEPKDKPPDVSNNVSKSAIEEVDVEEPLSIQPPEVIIEEDESRVITTNGTSSPADVPSHPPTPNCENPLKGASTPAVPSAVPSQISFLQQALAMGYPQPLHFLQPNLIEQQQQLQGKLPSAGNQNAVPPGLVQSKNIFSFVDLLKVMGAAIPPGSQPGIMPNSNGNGSTVPVVNSGQSFSANHSQSSSDSEKNPLTCHICARIMPSQQVLEEHVRIHEEEKPYKCEQCGQRYKYQSAFQRHQEQNHTAKLPGDKPYRCDVCGQCFKYHKSFTKHRANHDLLDTFMKAEPGEGGGGAIRALQESYLQRLLHPTFGSPDTLATTIKEEAKDSSDDETKGTKSPCLVSSTSLQGGSFGSENGDIKEEEDDIDIDEIVPDVPGDGEEDLEDSPSGRFFFCVQCKLTFRDSKSFEGHCRLSPGCSAETLKEVAVGGDISVTSIPSSVGNSPQGSPQPSQSGGVPGSSTQASIPLTTSLVFSSPPAMLYTLVSGLPQSSCFPSSSVTPTILNLSKLVNFGGVPTLANAMRGSDSMTLNFSNAVAGLHGGVNSLLGGIEEERPFKCPYCQKGFKGRENLKLHIRTHTGEKPYNCGVCGKAFGGRSDMNRHLRIHTGEKPYPCKVCGKKFARADYLSKHITTHLGIPFAKPVHSLQQSLQNLENMQNLQNLENMQNLQTLPNSLQNIQSLQASVANLQTLPSVVPNMQTFQGLQSISNLQNLQNLQTLQSFPSLQSIPTVQNLQNIQPVQSVPSQTTQSLSKDDLPNFTK